MNPDRNLTERLRARGERRERSFGRTNAYNIPYKPDAVHSGRRRSDYGVSYRCHL